MRAVGLRVVTAGQPVVLDVLSDRLLLGLEWGKGQSVRAKPTDCFGNRNDVDSARVVSRREDGGGCHGLAAAAAVVRLLVQVLSELP